MLQIKSLSIIICTKDRLEDLLKCLDSIKKQTLFPYELIIVDASTKDFQAEIKKLVHPSIRFQYLSSPPGLTKQRNIGIHASNGNILFFFDDDVILDPCYLEKAYEVYQKHPDCGGVTGKITNLKVNKNWRYYLYQCFYYLWQLTYYNNKGFIRKSGSPTNFQLGNTMREIQLASGCCMSFTKQALIGVDLFDETLKAYCYMEDVDIAARVSQKSTLYFCPEAKCVHNHSPKGRLNEFEAGKMFMKNYRYLFRKNLPQRIDYKFAHAVSIFFLLFTAFYNFRLKHYRGLVHGISD